MHLFRIRSKSQKPSDRSQDSNQASNTSSRPPLLPQTNLALSTQEDARPSPSPSAFSDKLDLSKPQIGRKISLCEPNEPRSQFTSNLTSPPRTAQEITGGQYYSHNDLNTFSFGTPSSESSSQQPVDPLSRPRRDSDADDLPVHDTTPRPSVASTQRSRSHQSQLYRGVGLNQASFPPSQIKFSKGASQKPHERDSDTASTHTFGTSSSSRPSGVISRASRTTSSRSDTTSDNNLSSDEELGCHPLPAEFLNGADQDISSMFEEEYDFYNDEYERDPELGIEIDSVAHPGSDRCTIDYRNASRESVPFNYAERRDSGVLPITIPSDKSYLENQENTLHTLRRPSRSLDELHSFNFTQEAASSSFAPYAEHPLPPSPTSVPESEGDWRDLRKKSIQRDKDLPSISPRIMSLSSSGLDGFDTSWMHQHANGFIGFDSSEMQDIVVADMIERRSLNHPLRRGSAISASRRQSNASSGNVDIWYRQATGWASQKDRDQRQMWIFVKENDRLAHEDHSRQNNHVERERPSISNFFGSRPSSSTVSEPGVNSGISLFDGRDKGKAAGKEKAPKEIWRGMLLDSEEFWNNQATGRFRVHRRNTPSPEAGKPPQHRLNITFIRTPSIVNPLTREVLDGPSVTIHRHSKADAFSISRHFRARGAPSNATVSLRDPASSSRGQSSFKDPSDGTRKKSNMILLATRKVQKAYTSTTTTRMLQSHGLLDRRTSPRDLEGMKREYEREKRAKDQNKEKDKKEREALKEKKKSVSATKKITNKTEKKSKDPKWLPDSSGGSVGSVSNALSSDSGAFASSSTSATTPDLSEGSSSFGSIERSVISYETTSSDRTVLRPISLQRRHPNDIGDDSSDEGPKYPTRTPHRETYAVLPPEVFEIAHHQEHPTHGLFGWGKSKGGNQIGHRPNPYEASYNPPWPVTTPRINSETRKGIVDDLNMSFQDVGLLPAIGEIRSSQSEQIRRRREREQRAFVSHRPEQPQAEIFEDIPSDSLCMLLPLWPSETDPASARKYQSAPSSLSPDSRQYILIYYKVQPGSIPPHEEAKAKVEKKRSRNSPTSSHESTNKREERGILLNNFYIGARVVSHRDLQGSGIRIPDVGLAVSGPLDEAYRSMPTNMPTGEYILGVCNSRNAGIDFLPEFFETMGLSRNMPNPNPVGAVDDDDSQSPDVVAVLTPLGRAVMEMAWLGGLALTSFNPSG